MAKHADRLKKLLAGDQRTANSAQRSLVKAEDALSSLEEREERRRERTARDVPEVVRRLPAAAPEGRAR